MIFFAASWMIVPIRAQTTLTILHNFGDGTVTNDGIISYTGTTQDSAGNFYGTTYSGGATNDGTIFRISPDGSETMLHSFGANGDATDGTCPQAGLIKDRDGNFYGTTHSGGSTDQGTIFRVTPSGSETILHCFGDGSIKNDGTGPKAGLIQGSDGILYGTTSAGGSASAGVVFKITMDGAETILHNFGDGSTPNDGVGPQASLTQSSDGNFYGSTVTGGSKNKGTIFRISPSGTMTILHSFGSILNDGASIQSALIQGATGDFYGTTPFGGSVNKGVIFKIASSGIVTILHSFGDGSIRNDGNDPQAALIQGSNGDFYGTTYSGGSTDHGTLFETSPAGLITILRSFGDGSMVYDGRNAQGSLTQDSEGHLYGTTATGGTANDGTFFEIRVSADLHNFTANTQQAY
jgi:uncharacterized repeat protein (TIGR03803 family)